MTRIMLLVIVVLASACAPLPPADPYNLAEAKDHLSRGNYWYLRGCHKEAARFFGESLAFARLSDNVPMMVMGFNAAGAAAMARDLLTESAENLEEALELSLGQPEHPELDSILGNLGTLAFKAGREQDAEEFWRQAVLAAVEKKVPAGLYYCNLARLYLSQNRMAEFGANVELALVQSGGQDRVQADALNLAATLALSEERLAEAESYLTQALTLDRHTENQVGLAQDLELQAKLAQRQGQAQAAGQSLERAFYLRAALKDRVSQKRILNLLEESSKTYGWPKQTGTFRKIYQNPDLFDPISRECP